jgi:glycosyltransferase involved in cell wall biosynthesis
MKVLLVAPRFFDKKFGERRAVMSAYKTAFALSHHCQVVVVTAGPPPRYERINKNLVVYRLWDLFLPDPVNYGIVPGIFWQLPKIIKKEQPTAFLVNKHMFFTSFATPILRLMGKRVVLQTDTFVGINWFLRNRLLWPLARLYAYTFGLLVLKSANKVVLLHEGLIPVAKKLRLPYTVIHNGVDLKKFQDAKPAADISKKKGEVFIAYVGRLESVKGYDDLLAVAEKTVKKYRNVKFFFVGMVDGREEIVKKYESEQIIFTGHRTDIPAVLKRMDIFVLPSYSEGLPNVLMEAMSVGCACLASDVGGVKVLLLEGGGLTFHPGDRGMLERQLLRLVEDPALRNKLGAKASARIARDFDQDKEIPKLIKVLQNT